MRCPRSDRPGPTINRSDQSIKLGGIRYETTCIGIRPLQFRERRVHALDDSTMYFRHGISHVDGEL